MKRTKRVTFMCNEVEIAQLTILKEKYHLSTRSGLIRMLIFYVQISHISNNSLPELNRPPRAPTSVKLDLYPEQTKFMADNGELLGLFSIELKIKMKERRTKIQEEEELLKEVEIK